MPLSQNGRYATVEISIIKRPLNDTQQITNLTFPFCRDSQKRPCINVRDGQWVGHKADILPSLGSTFKPSVFTASSFKLGLISIHLIPLSASSSISCFRNLR